jgi:hypothetical protein
MASSALPWADTRAYLGALDALLATSPDLDALAAWRSAKQELAGVMSASGAGARRLLADLQASLAQAEAGAAGAALPLEELRLRLEQVEARKDAVVERVQRMAAERDASAGGMQRLLQATLELKEEQRRLEAMKKTASPHLQCGRARPRRARAARRAPRRAARRARLTLARPPFFCLPRADTSSRSTST